MQIHGYLREVERGMEMAKGIRSASRTHRNLSCVNQNVQLLNWMGSKSTRIETINVAVNRIRSAVPTDRANYVPPFRSFSQSYKKVSADSLECLLMVNEPYEECLEMTCTCYHQMFTAFEEKTKTIVLHNVFEDSQYLNRFIFQCTTEVQRGADLGEIGQAIEGKIINKPTPRQITLLLRSFSDYNCHSFCNILCEVNHYQKLRKLQCRNLHSFLEGYIVQSGIELLQEPNTYILELEPISATLSEIIQYRRTHRWEWTEDQFLQLLRDVLQGLSTMHSYGLAHNDIRPNTIYYSAEKDCFMLGSFANCMYSNIQAPKIKTFSVYNAPEYAHSISCGFEKGDVYALGISLLCAFYLVEPVNIREHLVTFSHTFNHLPLDIINSMISPVEQRKTAMQLKAMLPALAVGNRGMGTMVDSLRVLSRPDMASQAKAKLAYAEGYQRLGLWNEWKREYQESFQIIEPQCDEHQKADVLMKLAMIEQCRGEPEAASEDAKRAAVIYRGLAAKCVTDHNYNLAESYYEKSLSCCKFYIGPATFNTSQVLRGLAEIHSNNYENSMKLLDEASLIVEQTEGKDSLEYIRLDLQRASLQSNFGQFDEAERIYAAATEALAKKGESKDVSNLSLELLLGRSKNFVRNASYVPDAVEKEKLLAAGEEISLSTLKYIDQLHEDSHFQLVEFLQVLGSVQFKRGRYDQAKKDYEKALEVLTMESVVTDQAKSKCLKQTGEVLCQLGSCSTFLGNHEQALDHYENALKTYRGMYGNDHNFHSAVAIGNMARVYMNLKEKVKARECLKLACSILEETNGKDDPDYEHFQKVEAHLDGVLF